jgi:hypothetical protein
LLDVRAALSAPAPPPDPLEPNDDIHLVRPGGIFEHGSPLLTSTSKRKATLEARLDQNKDPADVYRAWIPAHGSLRVTIRTHSGDVVARVWGPRTPTIMERGSTENRDLLATGSLDGRHTIEVQNRSTSGEIVYIDVSAGVSRTSSYVLSVATRS